MSGFRAAGAIALIVASFMGSAGPAHASFILTFTESGGNVVATGTGSIDTAALTDFSGHALSSNISDGFSLEFTGSGNSVGGDWSGISGPTTFTTGTNYSLLPATSGSGAAVGLLSNYDAAPFEFLLLPAGYVSGAALTTGAVWDGATFASLGLVAGSYTWTWGSGQTADTYTIDIGAPAPVPEPAPLPLLAVALPIALWLRHRAKV